MREKTMQDLSLSLQFPYSADKPLNLDLLAREITKRGRGTSLIKMRAILVQSDRPPHQHDSKRERERALLWALLL